MPPKKVPMKKSTKRVTALGRKTKAAKTTKNMLYNAKGKALTDAQVRRYVNMLPAMGGAAAAKVVGKATKSLRKKVMKKPSTLNRQSRPRSR